MIISCNVGGLHKRLRRMDHFAHWNSYLITSFLCKHEFLKAVNINEMLWLEECRRGRYRNVFCFGLTPRLYPQFYGICVWLYVSVIGNSVFRQCTYASNLITRSATVKFHMCIRVLSQSLHDDYIASLLSCQVQNSAKEHYHLCTYDRYLQVTFDSDPLMTSLCSWKTLLGTKVSSYW